MFEGEGKIRPIDFVSSTEVNTARSKLRNLSDWSGEFSIYKVIVSTYGGHIDAIHTHKLSPNLTPAPQRLVRRERETTAVICLLERRARYARKIHKSLFGVSSGFI